MIASGMKEARQKSIRVEVASAQDFDFFYSLLLPGAWSPHMVTENNVDALLTISDYYQVGFIREGCEATLLLLPVAMERLLQAHRHGLTKQCERCVHSLAADFTEEDLAKIREASPELLLQAASAMRGQAATRRRRLEALEPELKKARSCARRIQGKVESISGCTQALEPGNPFGPPNPPPTRQKLEELKVSVGALRHELVSLQTHLNK